MLNPSFTDHFKNDFALLKDRGKDMGKLIEVFSMIVDKQPLLPKYETHPLEGDKQGKWECHIEPNWLVIYRIDEAKNNVIFYRTGNHSDLF